MNRSGERTTPTRTTPTSDDAGARSARTGDTSSRAVYVISVAAELGGVHPQTLRIYERKGLLEPARTGGGNRRYSDDDIARLRRIQRLTAAGINLGRLADELDLVRSAATEAVDRTHRHYRRDLVPVETKGRLPAKWRG
jgi:MerR family transcriptional regulator/heat shock protein HspR